MADDVDEAARAELQRVLVAAMTGDVASAADLADRMAGPLTFGTAGLRGPVRAGPNGMNRSVVVRTTAGVASWLLGHGHGGGVVVVGRDARRGSTAFAEDAAAVLTAAGFVVRMLADPLPTPVLAFAVRHLGAVAGVQITASHNPPADNGYKLYDASGAQSVPPADREIEAAIAAAPAAVSVARAAGAPVLGDDLLERYLDRVAAVPRGSARAVRIALTPLHGVGGATVVTALRRAGFTDVHVVNEQFAPDADFPTVTFPNPEEPGATDRLLDLARAVRADLAIALDPDADRCALGIATAGGTYRMLRGDEVGALFGEHILSTVEPSDVPLVATTVVSSSMLGSIARRHGARYAETLTGFKWLVRAGEDGAGLVYAYEEALGHCVDPAAVRDKDGISAAVLAADLAATLKAGGGSMRDLLDELAVRHGVHLTDQVSVRVDSPDEITALMARLRAYPPTALCGVEVAVEDLLPRTDALRMTGSGVRLVVRPSGTEPKLKAYLEVVHSVAAADTLHAAKAAAQQAMATLRQNVASLLAG
ncbi:MAG: phospho-sugar mutase [Haloechinothrix sp.]